MNIMDLFNREFFIAFFIGLILQFFFAYIGWFWILQGTFIEGILKISVWLFLWFIAPLVIFFTSILILKRKERTTVYFDYGLKFGFAAAYAILAVYLNYLATL